MQLCAMLSVLMVLSSTTAVFAQAIDVTAPEVNHTVAPSGIAGGNLLIEAQVTDNVGVASVILFYRFSGESSYQDIPMSHEGDDQYAALVPTEVGVDTKLEYYIEASDAGGTKTTRGLSFDPLSVAIVQRTEEPAKNELTETPLLADSTPAQSETPVVPQPKSKKLWYVVGGVLLLGLAASALGGGGDGDGSGNGGTVTPTTGDCQAAGCSVTFTVGQP